MERKYVFPTYIKPAPVFLATSTMMIPIALPKTQIPLMQSTTWSTTTSTAAPIAKFSNTPALSTNSPCIDSVKIKEFSQFKSSFETQTIDQQIETLEKLNSTLKSGSHQLDFLEKKLKAVKAGISQEAPSVRNLQGTYDGIKCSLELVRGQIESAAHIFASNLRQKRESCKDLASKVVFVFETIALQDRLVQRIVPQAMLESCRAARQLCLTAIAITLEKKFKNQPDFFKNGLWENLCGSSEKEMLWQQLNATCSSVRKLINKVDEPHQAYKASLETLYKARLFFTNFAHQINAMTEMGSDVTGISTSETAPIHADLKDYNTVVNTCISCLEQKIGTYSAARFIQTEATPACMSAANDAKLWDMYVTNARNFVVAHYHTEMSADDIIQTCLQNGTGPTFSKAQLEIAYEQVVRRLVITSQTEHQLKAIGQSHIDVADVHEHLCACQEVRNIGKCLADMVVTLYSHIEHNCPGAKLREVGAIAEEMAVEAQNAERDRQRNRPVINQFCEFIGQALLQHNSYVSVATDLAGSYTAHAGSVKFDLSKTDGHDIVGACIAQAEKIKKQQEIPNSTSASDTHQASTSSAAVEPVQEAHQTQATQTTRRQEIIRNAARLLAQNKLNPQPEAAALAQACEPFEPFIMMADSGKPFAQQEVLFDFAQTVAGAHNASVDAAKHGDIKQAEIWAGMRDALGQLGALSLHLSGLDKFGQSYSDKLLIAAATGAAKGGGDFVQGTHQLLVHPQKVVQQLEQALSKLDHFAGQLYRNDPVAMAKVSAAIKACWDCPFEQKVEASFRLFVSLGLAPHAASKGIGLVAQVVQDSDLLGKAGTIARKIGTDAAKLADGLAEGKVAVTPEGVKIPVKIAAEGEVV